MAALFQGKTNDIVTVLFIGSGEINFGSPEGPWNHSKRLEDLLGPRLHVLGVVDPDVTRAQHRLEDKANSPVVEVQRAWSKTKVWRDVNEAVAALRNEEDPTLIVNGCPPQFRGTTLPGKDMDAQILKGFPNTRAILVEKPISSMNPFDHEVSQIATLYDEWSTPNALRGGNEGIIAVGYMLRYLSPIAKIRSTLLEHNLTPLLVRGSYSMAYPLAVKLPWWDKDISCGPVVEQATHFVDLIRYIASATKEGDNDVDMDSVQATTVECDEPAGKLRAMGFDEELISKGNRIPRLTTAFWKHKQGTVSTLTHAVALHGDTYETEIEIIADGWRFVLSDSYSSCPILTIRSPSSTKAETIRFPNEDPFRNQFRCILDSLDGKNDEIVKPLSDWKDALKTYQLTWKIRLAAEEESRVRRAAKNKSS